MKVNIFMEWDNQSSYTDSIQLEGTLEEVQLKAANEVSKRQPDNYWSQVIEE